VLIKQRNRFIYAVLAILMSVGIYYSNEFPIDAAFFPILVLALMLFFSLVLFGETFRKKDDDKDEGVKTVSIISNSLMMIIYCASIIKFGFFTASFLLLIIVPVLWARWVKWHKFRLVLLFACIICGFAYVVFVRLFGVPLPSGSVI